MPVKPASPALPVRFEATLHRGDGGGAYVLLPPDAWAQLGSPGRLKIQARIGGLPYQGSIMKMGTPTPCLIVLKEIRQQLDIEPGDTVHVELWPDTSERSVELPQEVAAALAAQPGLTELVATQSHTFRRELAQGYLGLKDAAKQAQYLARATAALQCMQRQDAPWPLNELLPIFPKAARAWQALSPGHRNQHIWHIAMAATPATAEKRANAAAEALEDDA